MGPLFQFLNDYQSLLLVLGALINLVAIAAPIESRWFRIHVSKVQRALLGGLGIFLMCASYLPHNRMESLPVGAVVAWDPQIRDGNGNVIIGKTRPIPIGWHICNGKDGTPDLSERFVMSTSDPSQAGRLGGTNTIPEERLTVAGTTSLETIVQPNSGGFETDPPGNETAKHTHYFSAEIPSHNHGGLNLPPYYKLVFIMKGYDE